MPNILGHQLVYKYSLQGTTSVPVFGTATAPATSAGIVRWNEAKSYDPREFRGAGSRSFIKVKGGLSQVPFDIEQDIQNADLMLLGVRNSAGILPYFTSGFGWDQGVGAREADQVRDCKVHTMGISLEAGEGGGHLTGRISGVGGVTSVITTLQHSDLTPDTLLFYEAIAQIDTDGGGAGTYAAFQLRSFDFNVNHNVKVGAYIRGAARTAGEERFFDYQDEGQEQISFTLVRHEKTTANFLSGVQDGLANVRITITDIADSTHKFILTLTGCIFDEERRAGSDADGYLLFNLPGRCRTFSIATS